jgi:transposase
LPRERIEVMPPAGERHCANCDAAKVRIGANTTEELDYVPASFVIREYVRPRYACGRCQQGVVQAVLPARPLEKGRPEPGLLAHVVSSKYADHLPLYRLEQIFARRPVRSTPLAVCDARSIQQQDLLKTYLKHEVYMVRHSASHRWFYFPRMQRDEVVISKCFDSAEDGRARFTAHAAFEDPTTPAGAPARQSIEARALEFFSN